MARTHKKTKRKVSRLISQSGGTLFNIRPGDLDQLQHIGIGHGADVGCAACVLNQIGFPVDIVNELSKIAAKTGIGVLFSTVRDKINQVKNRIDPSAPSTQMYSWGANWIHSKGGSRLVLSVVPDAESGEQLPFTSRGGKGLMTKAIDQVFNTVRDGTAAVLGILWSGAEGQDFEGHYVVIAKSRDGTPYLIEAQSGGAQGVYRGMDEVKRYFQKRNPAHFITFNNTAPYRIRDDWLLDLDMETQLDLSLLDDGSVPAHVDFSRSMMSPPVMRTGSYDITPPYQADAAVSMDYEEGAGSGHVADHFHQSQGPKHPNPFGLKRYTKWSNKGRYDVYCDICGKTPLDGSYSNKTQTMMLVLIAFKKIEKEQIHLSLNGKQI